MPRSGQALRAALRGIACGLALVVPAAAAEQQVVYRVGLPWAVVALPDGCVAVVSTLADEWEEGPGTFSWSGGCSAKGYIEGPGTLRRQYKGREYHADGKVVPFDREWNMHAAAVNGLIHGVGEKSYGGQARDQFKYTHGCSQYADGAGGWTEPFAGCSSEDGEAIGLDVQRLGGPAVLEAFRQLLAQENR